MYRTWMRVVVIGLLAASPVWADSRGNKPAKSEKDKPVAAKAAAPAAPAKERERAPAAPAGANYGAEIEQLRQMVLEQSRQLEAQRELMLQQQGKLEALTEELRSARSSAGTGGATPEAQEAGQKVMEGQLEAVADATNELNKRVATLDKDYQGQKKSLNDKVKGLGPFSFSGDLRLRGETFNAGTLAEPRYRGRYRVRFNVGAKLTDELSGGLTVASGDATDPVSTNQSFTGFFTRKYFSIDRAFLSYKPKWFKNALHGDLDLTGGKYAYTWYRTPLTFDNDLNPEGLSQSISWSFKDSPLERITLVGVQTFLAESSGGMDTTMYGGQVQLVWKLGDSVRVATYGGFFDFNNTDAVRVALNNASATVAGCTPLPPATSCTVSIPGTAALSGNAQTNSASGTQYASRFGILDATLRVDIKTPISRFPVMAQFNIVNNTRACTNHTSAGLPVTPTNAPCNPRDRTGYLGEIFVGRLQERNDFQFGYGLFHIEREAVLAAFNESDLRQPTNLAQNRVSFGWQAYRNVQLIWTGWFGRQLTTGTASQEDILRRLQFDLIYKF